MSWPASVTVTTNGHWVSKEVDRVGRTIREWGGDAGGDKIFQDTEYESCACSPLGKVKRVSQPYAPGGTVYWTTYTFGGLGRTLSVSLPGNSGTTTYVYEGNTVRVTDPTAFDNLTGPTFDTLIWPTLSC